MIGKIRFKDEFDVGRGAASGAHSSGKYFIIDFKKGREKKYLPIEGMFYQEKRIIAVIKALRRGDLVLDIETKSQFIKDNI